MGKKRRLGQLEAAAAAPPKPAEAIADDAREVAKGEVKSEEVVHKRKKKKRSGVMEMQSTVTEQQCGEDDVEKIELPKKKRTKKNKKEKPEVASVDGKPGERKTKKPKLSTWKKQVEAKWKERVERGMQVCSEQKPKPINCSDVCVICRLKGHIISTCPLLSQTEDSNKGNKLPDCPQPLQDADLKNGEAEKLLGCPPVETL